MSSSLLSRVLALVVVASVLCAVSAELATTTVLTSDYTFNGQPHHASTTGYTLSTPQCTTVGTAGIGASVLFNVDVTQHSLTNLCSFNASVSYFPTNGCAGSTFTPIQVWNHTLECPSTPFNLTIMDGTTSSVPQLQYIKNSLSIVAVIVPTSSSSASSFSSSTGFPVLSSSSTGPNNSTGGNDGEWSSGVSRLAHIALGTSLGLICLASILACLLRKKCSVGSHLQKEPHTVQNHGGYNSMA